MAYSGLQTMTSTSAPASALATRVEDQLTAAGNWAFVKEYTANNRVVRVWRCENAASGWAAPFFLYLIRATATSDPYLWVCASETFDASTNLGARFTWIAQSQGYGSTLQSNGARDNGSYDISAYVSSSYISPLTLSTTTYDYGVVATKRGVTVWTSAGTGTYVGLFTPLAPAAANEFPLLQSYFASVGGYGAYGGFTRRPGATGSVTGSVEVRPFTDVPYELVIGTVPPTASQTLYGSTVRGARAVAAQLYGAEGQVRGLVDGLMVFGVQPGVARGDTITVDSLTYVCVYTNGSSLGVFARTTGI